MTKYYVRIKPQLDGENAVHKENCPFLDGIRLKRYLGEFVSAREAVKEAQKFYSHSKGCSFCNKELNLRAKEVCFCIAILYHKTICSLQLLTNTRKGL